MGGGECEGGTRFWSGAPAEQGHPAGTMAPGRRMILPYLELRTRAWV